MKPSATYYATEAQLAYLKRLLEMAFARGVKHGLHLDPNHLSSRMPRDEASLAISALRQGLGIKSTMEQDAAAERARAELGGGR